MELTVSSLKMPPASSGCQSCPKAKWRKTQGKDREFHQTLPPGLTMGRSALLFQLWCYWTPPRGQIWSALTWFCVLPGTCTSCNGKVWGTQCHCWFSLTQTFPGLRRYYPVPCNMIFFNDPKMLTIAPVLVSSCASRFGLVTPPVPLYLASNLRENIQNGNGSIQNMSQELFVQVFERG